MNHPRAPKFRNPQVTKVMHARRADLVGTGGPAAGRAALLDLDEPWKVIRRSKPYLPNPREACERVGILPN